MGKPSRRYSDRPINRLERVAGNKKSPRVVEIHCEGRVTEPAYLYALKEILRHRGDVVLHIEKGSGRDPLRIVSAAVESKRLGGIDEIWCAFDVDEHQTIDEAVRLALNEDINLAISNPCFELWLILHFQDQIAHIGTADAVKLRAKLDGSKDKKLDASIYVQNIEIAQQRAQLLDIRHKGTGNNFPKNNPSSGMHKLLKTLGFESHGSAE